MGWWQQVASADGLSSDIKLAMLKWLTHISKQHDNRGSKTLRLTAACSTQVLLRLSCTHTQQVLERAWESHVTW